MPNQLKSRPKQNNQKTPQELVSGRGFLKLYLA